MKTPSVRIYLAENDPIREALRIARERFGLSASAFVRMAVAKALRSDGIPLRKIEKTKRKR